jgi:hypothetical protein
MKKRKNLVRGAPTNIIPTHITKTYGFKVKIMDYLFAHVEDYDFGLQFWFWGLIMSKDKDCIF